MRKLLIRVGVALFISVSGAGSSLAAPLEEDQPGKLPSGATYMAPKGWTLDARGPVRIVTSPEGDASIGLVDALVATDATAAVAEGWRVAFPSFTLTPKLANVRAGREGWDERTVFDYETSPNERRYVMARAHRKGSTWTVFLYDGAEATTDKRWSAISLMLSSLRAPGHTRETFAGRVPHKLDSARIARLKTFLVGAMGALGVPGVGYALIQDGEVVDVGGLGHKRLGTADPVGPDTQFLVASNTKGMSTLMLATLVDEGKVTWEMPVTRLYPAFRLGDAATTAAVRLRHLVCACTGLPRKDLEWFFHTSRDTDPANVFPLLAATQPTSGFGEVFQYNNLITSAGGFIGGHVAHPDLPVGAAYDKAMAERVFGPLGMTRTHFSFERALAGDHATPHGSDINGQPAMVSYDTSYSIVPYRPAGGAWSTARDMAQYVRLELSKGLLPDGRRLVSEANLLERRKHGIPSGEDQWYGMGLIDDTSSGVSVISHGGSMPGFHTNWWVIPDAGVGAVLLTNAEEGASLLYPFQRRLLELLYDGRPEADDAVSAQVKATKAWLAAERPKLQHPPSAELSAALASRYASPDLGPLVVKRVGADLRFEFMHWSTTVAGRRNDDGSTSFVSIDPAVGGYHFVVGSEGYKRTLTVREGQHEYAFVEADR